MLNLRGKRVVVVGLGASGVAAARLCLRRGAHVVANDAKERDALGADARALEAEGAEIVAGGHAAAGLASADLIVVSPGVPTFAELESAEKQGVRVIGEVELATASLMHSAPIVAIGGTNGKSTTTSLVAAMLEAHGARTFAGGNLGEPLASHADETFDAIVLEVSSFQMERLETFAPRVSVLLNVTEDHLDRYASFEAYAHAKGNAFARQTAADTAIVPFGDAVCLREATRGQGRVVTFGPGGDLDVTDDAIVDSRWGELRSSSPNPPAGEGERPTAERYLRADFTLQGGHNALNAAAAIAAVRELGVTPATIRRVLGEFRGLPHRMVLVSEIDGVRYYDDSKGTNVGAVVTALTGLREPKAVLIAGGRDKEGSYAPLVAALREKGRAAVLIGEAADLIARAIDGAIPIARAASMDEAVRAGAKLAMRGDAVLLSPACSSYDMFRDYKHRGDEFVRAVHTLRSREETRS